MSLPTDPKEREDWQLWDYMFNYFPDAWLAEVEVSVVGNKQHGLGQTLHWAREKSTDHRNKALRHLFQHSRGEVFDTDGARHLAKAVWRLKAWMQTDIEAERANRELVERMNSL